MRANLFTRNDVLKGIEYKTHLSSCVSCKDFQRIILHFAPFLSKKSFAIQNVIVIFLEFLLCIAAGKWPVCIIYCVRIFRNRLSVRLLVSLSVCRNPPVKISRSIPMYLFGHDLPNLTLPSLLSFIIVYPTN